MPDPNAFPMMPGLAPLAGPQQPQPFGSLPPLVPSGPVNVSPKATLAPMGASPFMLTLDPAAGPPRPAPSGLPQLTGPIQIDSGPTDLRPLAAPPPAPTAPAGVDPSKIVTGRPQPGQGGAPGGAPGSDYLTEWNNIVDAQKRELLNRPRGGGMVRPKAPEPLLRMGALQNEAGKIDTALATFDRDLAYRKADNTGDLVAEQEAGIKRLEELDAAAKERMAAAQQRLDDINGKLASGEYDPDRLWHKADTGRKAGFQVAAILAGIGQSIAGRGGQTNSAVGSLLELMDRDNKNQIELINQGRAKASEAAKFYRDVAEQTGSDRAAVHALNALKLDALRSKFESEYEVMKAKMPISGTKIDPQTGQPLPTTQLDLRLQKALNEIGQRRAQEDLAFQQAVAAATKPIGGGGMTREQQLAKLAGLTKAQVEAQRDAQKDAAAQGKDQHAIFVGGQKMLIDPNAPKEAAFEAQKKINMADMGLKTLDSVEGKLKKAPAAGYLEKGARMVGLDRVADAVADEGRLIGTDQMTALGSQLSGAGVPSEVQARLFKQLFAGGPGADAAIGEMRRILNQGKQITIQGTGVR